MCDLCILHCQISVIDYHITVVSKNDSSLHELTLHPAVTPSPPAQTILSVARTLHQSACEQVWPTTGRRACCRMSAREPSAVKMKHTTLVRNMEKCSYMCFLLWLSLFYIFNLFLSISLYRPWHKAAELNNIDHPAIVNVLLENLWALHLCILWPMKPTQTLFLSNSPHGNRTKCPATSQKVLRNVAKWAVTKSSRVWPGCQNWWILLWCNIPEQVQSMRDSTLQPTGLICNQHPWNYTIGTTGRGHVSAPWQVEPSVIHNTTFMDCRFSGTSHGCSIRFGSKKF